MMKHTKSVAVIGGGIAGCSTAHTLAKRGLKVHLFEKKATLADEASGNPVGLLYPRLSGENPASSWALACYLYSLSFYKTCHLSADVFNACGMLQLGFNAREQARISKVAVSISAEIARFVNAKEASMIAGIACDHAALYFPQAAWIKPKVVCEKMVQHENISVYTLSNINKLLNNNDFFEIYCDNKLIASTDIVVIANGNAAAKFPQTSHLNTQSVRGQLSQLQATQTSQALKTLLCSDGYLSPAIDGQHSLGATFSIDDHSTQMTLHDHQSNLAKLNSLSTGLHASLQHNIISGRTAFRCVALDHFPMVGEILNAECLRIKPPRPTALPATLPWHPNLYVNMAHGSHGFISAPLSAEILAGLIFKETLPIGEKLTGLLNPNRFILRDLGLKKLAKSVASRHANDSQPQLKTP